ncbi:NEP domain-containing protein, partial [Cephalotus follicularis]
SDESPYTFDKMHGFSTVDGFVEISEGMAEMIKYVANEPSVDVFYVQQHTQNAVHNVISLRNNVAEESRETASHTEDLDDSIAMVRSMKECGLPIADEMIRDIKKSLVVMTTKQPRRGLINPSSVHSSWGPVTWGSSSVYAQKDGEKEVIIFNCI